MHLGDIIKTLRKEQGVTQEELAAALNISAQSVSKWENGAANPDINYIPLIARFFKVSIDSLFLWDSEDYTKEYKNNMEIQKQLLIEDDIDSIIDLWEDMYYKYPNDYRILKQLISAMCSKNDKELFYKIFKYTIVALKNNKNKSIENEILEALKSYMQNETPQNTAQLHQTQTDLNNPLNQYEVNALFQGIKRKSKGKRVMVVDDSQFMRQTLMGILINAGYEVVGEAANGNEAVHNYKLLIPDIVIMDIVMPEKDGVEASKEILRHDPEALIVMCSAMPMHNLLLESIKFGVSAFVAKPFTQVILLEVLGEFV